MSTILPEETRRIGQRLREQGVAMVDAPVGRTSAHAVTGTSTFMVGGDAADVERARPLLLSMGEAVTHCGPLARTPRSSSPTTTSRPWSTCHGRGAGPGPRRRHRARRDGRGDLQTPAGQGPSARPGRRRRWSTTPPRLHARPRSQDLGLALDTAARLRVPLATGAAAPSLRHRPGPGPRPRLDHRHLPHAEGADRPLAAEGILRRLHMACRCTTSQASTGPARGTPRTSARSPPGRGRGR